jgi:hypothetical protein
VADDEGRKITGWHVATAALSAISVILIAIVLVLLVGYTDAYYKDHEHDAAPTPSVTSEIIDVDPSPVPDQPAATLADQVAVAFSNATGWPYQENKFDFIFGFTSVDNDLLVKTNLTDPTDMSELCTLIPQLEDPVLGIGDIDQVLVLGTDGQVIWSCLAGG